ncbi:unnamed protein product [Gordionus sp. m RMFG-2023]
MQSNPDRENKYILVYQDLFTKFVILRPIKNKTATNLAKHLISIFNIFGAPKILYTDNGRELKNESIQKLVDMWPGCKIMHGRRKDSISHGLVERANKDIMNKLRCFLHDNKTTCWANALGTIQFQKNISYHRGIKSSPYEVMFGHKPNIWDSSLTKKLEDTGDDTAYLDDDKSYFHNLVNYTDSEDSDEFENNSNSIREDCITPDPVDFENNSNSIREDCISPDPVDFENNSNSIREDCISPDPVDFENNSNSIREDCITPDPAECEKNHKSVQIYCPSPDLATEDDTIRKHINAIKKIRKISKEDIVL